VLVRIDRLIYRARCNGRLRLRGRKVPEREQYWDRFLPRRL